MMAHPQPISRYTAILQVSRWLCWANRWDSVTSRDVVTPTKLFLTTTQYSKSSKKEIGFKKLSWPFCCGLCQVCQWASTVIAIALVAPVSHGEDLRLPKAPKKGGAGKHLEAQIIRLAQSCVGLWTDHDGLRPRRCIGFALGNQCPVRGSNGLPNAKVHLHILLIGWWVFYITKWCWRFHVVVSFNLVLGDVEQKPMCSDSKSFKSRHNFRAVATASHSRSGWVLGKSPDTEAKSTGDLQVSILGKEQDMVPQTRDTNKTASFSMVWFPSNLKEIGP